VQSDATLAPGDTFEVSVYGQPDLSGKYRIAEDGGIDFPLVGHVAVAGKGPAEIADMLRTALLEKRILKEPSVSVFLLEQKSKQVSVMGAVVRPGGLALMPGMTIIQAISAAGGLTGLAAGNDTIVTRQVDGELMRYKVPVERISEGRADDFELRAGDIVFVPERIF
jgi:polysaccharide export outer membrane protein